VPYLRNFGQLRKDEARKWFTVVDVSDLSSRLYFDSIHCMAFGV